MTEATKTRLFASLTALCALVASLAFSARTTTDSERKWCSILNLSLSSVQRQAQAYRDKPPSTPTGIEVQRQTETSLAQIIKLRRDLHCH